MEEIYLKPNKNSKTLPSEVEDRLIELSYNGIMLYCEDETFPLPWDATISVEGSDLVLAGGAGSNGYGSCVVKLPIDRLPKSLKIYIEPIEFPDYEKYPGEEIETTLKRFGWL